MKNKFVTTFSTILISILVVFCFILLTSKSDLLFKTRSFVVLSGSMEPEISVGSVVFSQKSALYNIGDVVSFDKQGITISHRLVEVIYKNNQAYYRTKGDANNSEDLGEISEKQIIGKEIWQIPYLGYLIVFLKTIPGFLLLFGTPGILYILLEMKTIKEEWEKEIINKFTNQQSPCTSSGFEML